MRPAHTEKVVDLMHARCCESRSQTIRGTESIRPEEAEQSTPSLQCRTPCLHWRPTRASGRPGRASESGAALSQDEAHGATARVGFHIWIQRTEESCSNPVRPQSKCRITPGISN